MMTASRHAATILLCLTLLAGCGEPPAAPDLSVQGLGGIKPDLLGTEANLKLQLVNPHPDAVELAGITVEITANGKPFAKGVAPLKQTLAPFSTLDIIVPVTLSNIGLARAASETARSSRLDHSLVARISYAVQGSQHTATIKKSGDLPLEFLKR